MPVPYCRHLLKWVKVKAKAKAKAKVNANVKVNQKSQHLSSLKSVLKRPKSYEIESGKRA
jgi:hypothetical protein